MTDPFVLKSSPQISHFFPLVLTKLLTNMWQALAVIIDPALSKIVYYLEKYHPTIYFLVHCIYAILRPKRNDQSAYAQPQSSV